MYRYVFLIFFLYGCKSNDVYIGSPQDSREIPLETNLTDADKIYFNKLHTDLLERQKPLFKDKPQEYHHYFHFLYPSRELEFLDIEKHNVSYVDLESSSVEILDDTSRGILERSPMLLSIFGDDEYSGYIKGYFYYRLLSYSSNRGKLTYFSAAAKRFFSECLSGSIKDLCNYQLANLYKAEGNSVKANEHFKISLSDKGEFYDSASSLADQKKLTTERLNANDVGPFNPNYLFSDFMNVISLTRKDVPAGWRLNEIILKKNRSKSDFNDEFERNDYVSQNSLHKDKIDNLLKINLGTNVSSNKIVEFPVFVQVSDYNYDFSSKVLKLSFHFVNHKYSDQGVNGSIFFKTMETKLGDYIVPEREVRFDILNPCTQCIYGANDVYFSIDKDSAKQIFSTAMNYDFEESGRHKTAKGYLGTVTFEVQKLSVFEMFGVDDIFFSAESILKSINFAGKEYKVKRDGAHSISAIDYTVKSIDDNINNPFEVNKNWSGSYNCIGYTQDFKLKITKVDRNEVVANFLFTKYGKPGDFTVLGFYDHRERKIKFKPVDVKSMPGGMSTVGFSGALSADGNNFSGKIDSKDCKYFNLKSVGN